jgi:hypothetical protein
VANTQWLDKSHPQTLLSANMLLYFFAGLWILEALLGVGNPFFGLLAIPAIFAGLGIANEKKLGYWGGVAVAVVDVLFWLWNLAPAVNIVINLIFAAALVALLVHPMSRSYERIWFKPMKARGPKRRR